MSKPKTEIDVLGDQLRQALGGVRTAESNALQRAVRAGELVARAREWIEAHPTHLQSFPEWFRRRCKGFSLRSAYDYESVYLQVSFDSETRYRNIKEALRAYQRRFGKRERFTPAQKILGDQAVPALPPGQKVTHSLDWWLGDTVGRDAPKIGERARRVGEVLEDARQRAPTFSAIERYYLRAGADRLRAALIDQPDPSNTDPDHTDDRESHDGLSSM
jgi:hypothetical protein